MKSYDQHFADKFVMYVNNMVKYSFCLEQNISVMHCQ